MNTEDLFSSLLTEPQAAGPWTEICLWKVQPVIKS